MPAETSSGGGSALVAAPTDRLLEMLETAAAKGADGFNAATWTSAAGDVPKPHGLFTASLLGGLWPTESESALRAAAASLSSRATTHEDAAVAAKADTERVFTSAWTDGEGSEAAARHYEREHAAHYALHSAMSDAGAGTARISESIGSAKLKMRTAHDQAHQEIDAALRAAPAGAIVNVAPIIAKYRAEITSYAAELVSIISDEVSGFSKHIPMTANMLPGVGAVASGGVDMLSSRIPPPASPSTEDRPGEEGAESSGSAEANLGLDQGGSQSLGDNSGSEQAGSGTDQGGSQSPGDSFAQSGNNSGAVVDPYGTSSLGDASGASSGVGMAPVGQRPPLSGGLPSMPSTSGGGSTSSLSGAATSGAGPLGGLMGGQGPNAGSLSNAATTTSPLTQSAAVSAASSSVGDNLGRGIAAGSQASGAGAAGGGGGAGSGVGSPAGAGAGSPLARNPLTPLVPPLAATTASAAAAPTSAPAAAGPAAVSGAAAATPAAAPAAAGGAAGPMGMAPAAAPMAMPPAPAAAAGGPPVAGGPAAGGPSTPLSPYGSVLPPSSSAPGAAGGPTSGPVAPGSPAAPAGAGAGGAAAAGFVPPMSDSRHARVSRDVSMSDLELARAAVADLAAASSVTYPVLQWAVGVGRGSAGVPELWVASNEGNGYVPGGVYLPRVMALAARFDSDFDVRWFGWTHPGETVVRAIQARGDAVSAVATTWPHDSDLIREATPDVAIGVTANGRPTDSPAATLTRGRSHRLETIDAALFMDLDRADESTTDTFALMVTQEAAFNAGPELPGIAESVARAILSRRWPTDADWTALRNEYEGAVLMASAQRPGLFGIEDETQTMTYKAEYIQCRRMEALLAWQRGNLADVIYAARCAGVLVPITAGQG